ncbi:biotin--[acetyl-CoA-carboxylase] ligase [Pedobacter sp. AW1-32]|uniref:biotin--[acetyl-CoA-carboxylase] ligase n=1 Tax=Pedobacter sp. AW1-32 TaxID=3383026 RepID=UPI003FEFEA86
MQNNTFSTLFVGQNLIKLKEVDSTNNFLKNLLSNSEPLTEGTVIMADNQFAGRGQQGNVWLSMPGKNISMSLYFKPFFLPLQKQFYLNIITSLAVSEALSLFIPEGISVKWPNDIYHYNKKLGGILIENSLSGIMIKSTIIGIGINVNQGIFNADIEQKAASVIQILQKEIHLNDIIDKIFVLMEKYYLILKSGGYKTLHEHYLNRLYNFKVKANYKSGSDYFDGTIEGIDEDGRLVVEVNGDQRYFNFKEIEFLHSINTHK